MDLEFGRVNRGDLQTYESPRWSPTLSLKPHHFVKSEDVRAFLTGRSTPPDEYVTAKTKKVLESRIDFSKIVDGDLIDDGYDNDTYGTSTETTEQHFRDEAAFLAQLPSLPDSSVILITLAPDGICKSCIVGNHCSAINEKRSRFSRKDNLVTDETEYLMKIMEALVQSGFQEDTDYRLIGTTHVLHDYNRQAYDATEGVTERNFRFRSMLVRTGALRKISPMFDDYYKKWLKKKWPW